MRRCGEWGANLPRAVLVNWLEIEIVDPSGKTNYRNSFVPDLSVDKDDVGALAACGRARWKIENESFNTLKTKGYNLKHNFGHGKEHLSAVLTSRNHLIDGVLALPPVGKGRAQCLEGRDERFESHSELEPTRLLQIDDSFGRILSQNENCWFSTQPRKCTTSSWLRTMGSVFGFLGSGRTSSNVHCRLRVTL